MPSNRHLRSPPGRTENKPRTPHGTKANTRARNDYDEEAAYESHMNPESGLQSGPGGSVDAD